MVLNILDVYKYEKTQFIIDKLDYLLINLTQNAINNVNFLVKQKNILITNDIAKEIAVNVDNEITERIFVNILTNAIKFTPTNGLIILRAKKEDEFIQISITDTGTGIPADKLHVVFDKFNQISVKKTGKIRSTGIGLTFCKMAIEAHGGQINVKSEIEKGTTFYFSLPLENKTNVSKKATNT